MQEDRKAGIRQRTREARKAAGYEQGAMAEALGIEKPTYNKYETRGVIRNDLIPKFCELTKTSPGWLLTGQKSNEPLEAKQKNSENSRYLMIMKMVHDREIQEALEDMALKLMLEKQDN